MKKNSIVKDSIILTLVKVITLTTSMIQTMIISRIMTLTEYGTYSALLIIVSLGTIIAGLGLNNAVNFFFNKETDETVKKKYIDTIFSITIIAGSVFAILIYCFKNYIAIYYDNELIIPLIIYVVFRPMFANIIALYQQLYISVGKTKVIAIRNFLISFLQVLSIPITFIIFKDLRSVLIITVILDICQLLYFGVDFRKTLKINFLKINTHYIKPVLKYAIPMSLATMIAVIFKETDKLIIAKVGTIEDLAIYTNMSKQLPFEFIVLCFTTVITPVIVKLITIDKNKAIELWKSYLEFGYICTWILCAGAIICSKELLVFLYSETYSSGLNIFVIYLFIEMFKYTYFGLILSATGKTKHILYSSGIAMIANVIFNIIFYKIFGLIGPALVSLICTVAMGIIQLFLSCREMNKNFFEIIEIKKMIIMIVKLLIIALPCFVLKIYLQKFINNGTIILIIIYGLFGLIQILINKKRLVYLIKRMENFK